MEQPSAGYEPTVGTVVLAADGAKIGEVVAVHPDYVVIQKGILFPDDLYVPRSAFTQGGGDDLVIRLTADDVTRQGWDVPPPAANRDDEVAVFPTGERVQLEADEDAGG